MALDETPEQTSEEYEEPWKPGDDLYSLVSVEDWYWRPEYSYLQPPTREIKARLSRYDAAHGRYLDLVFQANQVRDNSTAQTKDAMSQKLKQASADMDSLEPEWREALMSLTWSGKKPFAVQLVGLLPTFFTHIPIIGDKADKWYFAVGWEFRQWRLHIWHEYAKAKDAELDVEIDALLDLEESGIEDSLAVLEAKKDALFNAWETWPDGYQNQVLMHEWLLMREYKLSGYDLYGIRLRAG